MQMYGIFWGISLKLGIVWVDNIMTPLNFGDVYKL